MIPAHWSWSLAPLSDDAVITGILVPLFTSVGGAAAYAVAAAARARPLRVGTALCWAARGAALGAVGQTIALLARLTVAGVVSDVRLGTILGVLAGWVAITATGALLSVRFRESPPGPSLLRAAAWAIGCVPLWCGAALLGALADNVRYPRYRDLGPFVAAFLAPLAFGALVVALLGLAIAVGSALADTRRGADNGSGAAT